MIVIVVVVLVLIELGWLSENVVDGLFVLVCLFMIVGFGVVFMWLVNGNVEVVLLNFMAANFAGIFLIFVLIYFYFGVDSLVDLIVLSLKLFV